jgi:hypothetical protein
MALFRRARPEPEKRADLERMIVHAFAERGVTGRLVHDPDDPLNTSLHSGGSIWGFANVMVRLLPEPERTWRKAIAAHVTELLAPAVEHDLTTPTGRTMLRARILPASVGTTLAMDYAVPFAPGLVEAMCVDLPTTVKTVGDEMLAGSDVAELRMIARRNLQAEAIDSIEEVKAGIVLAEGQSLFVASQLLNPEFVSERIGPAPLGFVAAIPDRHILFHHVVTGAASVPAITELSGIVSRIDRDHRPGGLLSPHTYFISSAGVQQITDIVDGEMRIVADGAFLDAISR